MGGPFVKFALTRPQSSSYSVGRDGYRERERKVGWVGRKRRRKTGKSCVEKLFQESLTHREEVFNRKMASHINIISVLIWFVVVVVFLSEVHLTSSLPRHKDGGIVTGSKYIFTFFS